MPQALSVQTARAVTLYRVTLAQADAWARGILTDFALRLANDPGAPSLFIAEFDLARGWRQVVRECRRLRPQSVIYRARSPVIERHGKRFGLRPWHRDEWANRYLVAGPTLDAILASFPT